MTLEPYASCPCGSGKKFKWCCQPIYLDIDKAFRQESEGQHDAALRIMDEVVAAHPGNPEAWGRKAELLYRNGKVEEAEAAVQKAFDINPQYPFGFLLRGLFRQEEGEIAGALLLFRKAADAYDPEAHDQLAHVYAVIGECELKLNRPVATRAALAIALHFQPANEDLRQAMDSYFGEKSSLPLSARREYRFRPAGTLPAERRTSWDQALARAATGKLTDAARAFWEQTEQDKDNAAAWYNLALARAWLGDNAGALRPWIGTWTWKRTRNALPRPGPSARSCAWAMRWKLRPMSSSTPSSARSATRAPCPPVYRSGRARSASPSCRRARTSR
jgi:tetratricopeptide (TPR) repeat protein